MLVFLLKEGRLPGLGLAESIAVSLFSPGLPGGFTVLACVVNV